MYLKFDVDSKDVYFSIRVSNHSKIDGIDDDTIEEQGNLIELNIFSAERKKEAISYLKEYFSKISKITPVTKTVFVNKVIKRTIKSKHDEIVLNYLKKIKIDTSKTDKQIQQSVIDYLIKKKTPVTLKKRDYSYSGGRWKLNREYDIKGNLQSISSTGKQITVNNETGKDFTFDNQKDSYLSILASSKSPSWKMIIEKILSIK